MILVESAAIWLNGVDCCSFGLKRWRYKQVICNKIVMEIKEIEEILPKRIEPDLAVLLEKLASLVSDTVSLGTHLMKWDADKIRAGDESMPPMMFLRNIIELGDAISILIKTSSIDPTKILLRSLLENTFGLEYMLEKETEKRALSYLT